MKVLDENFKKCNYFGITITHNRAMKSEIYSALLFLGFVCGCFFNYNHEASRIYDILVTLVIAVNLGHALRFTVRNMTTCLPGVLQWLEKIVVFVVSSNYICDFAFKFKPPLGNNGWKIFLEEFLS